MLKLIDVLSFIQSREYKEDFLFVKFCKVWMVAFVIDNVYSIVFKIFKEEVLHFSTVIEHVWNIKNLNKLAQFTLHNYSRPHLLKSSHYDL